MNREAPHHLNEIVRAVNICLVAHLYESQRTILHFNGQVSDVSILDLRTFHNLRDVRVRNDVLLSKSMVQDFLGFPVALFWTGNYGTVLYGFPSFSSVMLNTVS